MAFSYRTNYKDTGSRDVLPAGEYEVFVRAAKYGETQSKTPRIQIEMRVRSDIDQPCRNRMLFASLWLSANALQYTERRMNQIAVAVSLPDDKEYNDENEWGNDIVGKFMRVRVTVRKREGYDDDNEVTAYLKSTAPQPLGNIDGYDKCEKTQIPGSSLSAAAGFTQVDEDDLPF